MSATHAGPAVARRRRRRWALGTAIVLAVTATAGVAAFTRLAPTQAVPANRATAAPATARVVRTDLVDRIKVRGTVGYGTATPVAGRKSGTLTWLPAPGTVVNRGERLYAVDAVPVPLLLGDTPMYRELAEGAPDGPDVAVLQQNLAALGYSEVGGADGRFRSSTTRALQRWQKALKVKATGRLALGDVVVLPGVVRVDAVTAQLAAGADGPLLKVTGIDRVVTLELEESQRPFARTGRPAVVELADGRRTNATVRAVNAATPGDGDKAPKLAVTVSLDDAAVAGSVDAGPVTVLLTGAEHKGVLAVPVQALLALREGGYGLDVLDGDRHRLVAVQLGLFADGMVEVSGAGLAPDLRVVTTS